MKTIKDIQYLTSVRVLLRVDFNMPIKDGAVQDDLRLKSSLSTINYLRSKSAKVILIGHLESANGQHHSLQPVAEHINNVLSISVKFIKNIKNACQAIEELNNGDCVLLENLRLWPGEENNDKKFTKELASLGDIFINDAFSVCHRNHASIIGLPKLLPSYAGLQLEKEIINLQKAFNAEHPFIAIIGGAKPSTKMPLMLKLFDTADKVFAGNTLAVEIMKNNYSAGGRAIINLNHHKLLMPVDVIVDGKSIKQLKEVESTDDILDVGPNTVQVLENCIKGARFILWNGPLGKYENGYMEATNKLAGAIVEATNHGAISIVGGGDTVTAVNKLGLLDKFSFVSMGGGAMLEFLINKTLPGVEALSDQKIDFSV